MWPRRRKRAADHEADEVERRNRAFVDGLGLPDVDSVLDLVPFMEERFDRSIRLMPFASDPADPDSLDASAPCGLWLATGDTDYVFYDTAISRAHAEIIVGHEFGHMLGRHRGDTPSPRATSADSSPTSTPPPSSSSSAGPATTSRRSSKPNCSAPSCRSASPPAYASRTPRKPTP